MQRQPDGAGTAVTAGFRNAGWAAASAVGLAPATVQPLKTFDGAACTGLLYQRGGERTAVCIMHPREFLASHYMIPALLDAGAAVFVQASRSVGNDLRLEHEIILHDVAAGIARLREGGFERVVLLGNSGGASLYALYLEQSALTPRERLAETPAGRPTCLAEAELPPADGLVLLSPHPGQGLLLMAGLDPSVTDENDPMSRDPALDPFDPANGFGGTAETTRYPPGFLERYRAAQAARVARIDASALAAIAARRAAARRAKSGGAARDRAASAFQQVFTVWRTDADPRNWDLSIDPSERAWGSLWGADPFKSNWGSVGFGRVCTPESWLSTWSGLSSRASLYRTAPAVSVPTLMIRYAGDPALFPADAARIFESLGAHGKRLETAPGNHHGLGGDGSGDAGRRRVAALVDDWLHSTFGDL